VTPLQLILTLIGILIVIVSAVVDLYIYRHSNGFHRTPIKFSIGKSLKFWALGDRVLIEEDEFKSGYECSTCDGKGRTTCANCSGVGENSGKKCSTCDAAGITTCPACNGKGGIIVAPEISERRPSTGQVVSVGHKCKMLNVGDTVLYSNFAGYVVDLDTGKQLHAAPSTVTSIKSGSLGYKGKVTLRILHENEILTGMDGHLTLTNLRGKNDIAAYNP
jgi:co-chaperonin GroES (HSP10)